MSLSISNRLANLQEEVPKTTAKDALACLEFADQVQQVLHPEKIRDASVDYLTNQLWNLVRQYPEAAKFFGLPQDYPDLKERYVKPMVMAQRHCGIGVAPSGSDIKVLKIDQAPLSEKFNNFVNDIIQPAPEDKKGSLDFTVFGKELNATGEVQLGFVSFNSDGHHEFNVIPTIGATVKIERNIYSLPNKHPDLFLGMNELLNFSTSFDLEENINDQWVMNSWNTSLGFAIGPPINLSFPLELK